MLRRMILTLACLAGALATAGDAQAQQGYGRQWAHSHNMQDWQRFYHYPFVYYPQNFWSNDYYKSSESLYFRYPPEMRIPTYNSRWHNEYPQERRYHQGHQFILDTF